MAKWKPGQSGNPSGRPKIVGEVIELARTHTTDAIKTLVAIMQSKKQPGAARVAAANSLLDRGYGRPAQSVDVGISRTDINAMSDAELMAIAAGADNETPQTEH